MPLVVWEGYTGLSVITLSALINPEIEKKTPIFFEISVLVKISLGIPSPGLQFCWLVTKSFTPEWSFSTWWHLLVFKFHLRDRVLVDYVEFFSLLLCQFCPWGLAILMEFCGWGMSHWHSDFNLGRGGSCLRESSPQLCIFKYSYVEIMAQ